MTALAKTQLPGSLLTDYRTNGFFDEMFGREGGVLPHYEKVRDAFSRLAAMATQSGNSSRLCVESLLHISAYRAGPGGLHSAEN